MKDLLTKLCSPILKPFETGESKYAYRSSHRKILIAAGILFLVLAGGSLYVVVEAKMYNGLLPVIFFFAVSLVCGVVGLLGSDQAVARMWKSK